MLLKKESKDPNSLLSNMTDSRPINISSIVLKLIEASLKYVMND